MIFHVLVEKDSHSSKILHSSIILRPHMATLRTTVKAPEYVEIVHVHYRVIRMCSAQIWADRDNISEDCIEDIF